MARGQSNKMCLHDSRTPQRGQSGGNLEDASMDGQVGRELLIQYAPQKDTQFAWELDSPIFLQKASILYKDFGPRSAELLLEVIILDVGS